VDLSNIITVGTDWTDLAMNAPAAPSNSPNYTINTKEPTISSADITTPNGAYNAGDNIDITITYSKAVTIIDAPQIQLNVVGDATRYATYNSGSGGMAIVFRYTVQTGDNISDLGASGVDALGLNGGTIRDAEGNDGINTFPDDLTAENAVVIDTIAPAVEAGASAGVVTEQFTQDATTSDVGGSGIATYAWTKLLGPDTITFGSASAEDTTVNASGKGNYTLRLTVTDNAGNSNYDDVSFTWDFPILSYSPIDRATGIAITNDTATITFGGSTNITLLDASKVTLVDFVSNASRKGVAAVSGGDGNSKILNISYAGLENSHQYRINIWSGAVVNSNGYVNSDGVSYFTTIKDTAAPTIVSHTPASGAPGVATTVVPSLTFSEPMKQRMINSTNIQLKKYSDDSAVPATVSLIEGGTQVNITPTSALTASTSYYFAVSIGAQDETGNALATPLDSTTKADHKFTTAVVQDVVVDNVTPKRNSATANGTYLSGWRYTFRITVNTSETNMAVKFGDWINSTSGLASISANGNMRVLFDTATGNGIDSLSLVGFEEANITGTDLGSLHSYAIGNEYSDKLPAVIPIGMLDISTDPGKQIEFEVFTKLPEGTAAGLYSTSYGILTSY